MNTIDIPVRRITVSYPSEWDEMNREQAIYAGKMLYLLDNGKIDVDQFRKLMVDKFIRRVNNRAPGLNADDELDLWGNEWLLAETVNFFFNKGARSIQEPKIKYRRGVVKSQNKGETVIVQGDKGVSADDDLVNNPERESWEILPTFTKNLIPWFRSWRTGFRKYYGPGDFLQGMSFWEYKDSLAAMMKFIETKDELWLNRLTAILYRRGRSGLRRLKKNPDFDGQTRIAYNPVMVERNLRHVRKINPGIKYMALMYISGCLWNLRNNEDGIEIDGKRMNFSILFKQPEENNGGNDDTMGMIGLMMALAESGVFGNMKDVGNTDVWDILIRIYQLELDRREMEKIMSKHK